MNKASWDWKGGLWWGRGVHGEVLENSEVDQHAADAGKIGGYSDGHGYVIVGICIGIRKTPILAKYRSICVGIKVLTT